MNGEDIDETIRRLSTVDSYKSAESLLFNIEKYSGELTEEQLKIICFSSISNEQIYNAYICKASVKIIIEKNKSKIDEKLLKKIMDKFYD